MGCVAEIVAVHDADDPRLADYVRLTDVKLRTSMESAHGLFVAEGEKVVRRALAAGYPPRSLCGQDLGGRALRRGRRPALCQPLWGHSTGEKAGEPGLHAFCPGLSGCPMCGHWDSRRLLFTGAIIPEVVCTCKATCTCRRSVHVA
jgi:hypothetical protein